MIIFKISGTKYPIPTRWEDVTYRQYVLLIRSISLAEHISIFTGIPRETIEGAELRNLEKISVALSFLLDPPYFERTGMVGPYAMPTDITIKSTGQFEDLRGLLMRLPKVFFDREKKLTHEETETISDLYLEACAIYCQKIKDGKYDYTKVAAVKEELQNYSCAEVIGTGSFFLFRPLNLSPSLMTPFRRLSRLLRRWIQALPSYRRTSALLQHYFGLAVK